MTRALSLVVVVLTACAAPKTLNPMSADEVRALYASETTVRWRTDGGEFAGYTTFRPDGTVNQNGVIATGDPLWGKYGGKTTQKYNVPSQTADGTYTVLDNGYCVKFDNRRQQDCFQLFKRGINEYSSVSASEDGKGIVLREFSVEAK